MHENQFGPAKQGAADSVSIVDVRMPFAAMVRFVVKWSIAAIPALIILSVIWFSLAAVFVVIMFSLGR